MNMDNIKLLEKVEKLSKEKEDKEYQEKLKKAMPFIDKISKIKNELFANEYSNKVLKEIIEKRINFKFEHDEIDYFKFNINYRLLEGILQNNFNKSSIKSYSIEKIKEVEKMLIDIKKVIFYIYPIKEEIVRFFNILSLCSSNNIIDSKTIDSYLLTLKDTLHFNENYSPCYLNKSSSKNIYITYRGYSVSFDDDEFIKYIIVSEENLEIIKDVEKQLEEKIDKFIV
jgi:hypothetical protein